MRISYEELLNEFRRVLISRGFTENLESLTYGVLERQRNLHSA